MVDQAPIIAIYSVITPEKTELKAQASIRSQEDLDLLYYEAEAFGYSFRLISKTKWSWGNKLNHEAPDFIGKKP